VPDAMGLGLYFVEGEGPRFERPVRTEADVEALHEPDPERDLGYVLETVRLARAGLAGRVPLIGFSGSPWTLAAYMVEGGGSHHFARVKAMAYDRPRLLEALLERLVAAVTAYLNAQVRAGAQALMLFDTWGGILDPRLFRLLSLEPLKRVVAGLVREHEGRRVPVIVFVKGGGQWLEALAETGCDALGLDWTVDIGEARRRVGDRVALQGNLDPCALYAEPARIREEARRILEGYGPGSGHVFNLGHGVHPDTDPAHVAALVEAVHELSRPLHA